MEIEYLISVKLKERAASRGATAEPIEPNQTYQFGKNFKVGKLDSGTILHYEELDRIHPKQISALKNYLINDFGQTYFKLLNNTNMYVDDKKVEPVDILFATPGMRGFKDPMNDQSVKIEDKEWYDEKTQENRQSNQRFE